MIAITHSTAADWLRKHYPDPGFWETHDFDTAADRLEEWALNDSDAVEYCHNRPAVWKRHPGRRPRTATCAGMTVRPPSTGTLPRTGTTPSRVTCSTTS